MSLSPGHEHNNILVLVQVQLRSLIWLRKSHGYVPFRFQPPTRTVQREPAFPKERRQVQDYFVTKNQTTNKVLKLLKPQKILAGMMEKPAMPGSADTTTSPPAEAAAKSPAQAHVV